MASMNVIRVGDMKGIKFRMGSGVDKIGFFLTSHNIIVEFFKLLGC